jgi:hypothetical protein
MEDRMVEAKEIVESMNKEINLNEIAEMVKNNFIIFEHNELKYRVHLLSYKEKIELDGLRRKKFGELLQDKDILLEKELIKNYKLKGIDIESEIDNPVKKLQAKILDVQLKLGESLSKKESDLILKEYKKQLDELIKEKQTLETQKTLLLEFSLENQLLNYTAAITTYLSLDTLKDEKWERMFKSIEEFDNYMDEELINKAGMNSMLLQF